MAGIARQVVVARPAGSRALRADSGGETTVTVRGKGRGGRNVEFLLALASRLDGHASIHAIAGDTDGVDGAEESPARSSRRTRWRAPPPWASTPGQSLADNDGHGFFGALGDQVVTGPTLTNVNDFRAILIDRGQGEGALP